MRNLRYTATLAATLFLSLLASCSSDDTRSISFDHHAVCGDGASRGRLSGDVEITQNSIAQSKVSNALAPESQPAIRVAVLDFGGGNSDEALDTIGSDLRAAAWEQAAELLKQQQVNVVVIRVNSGGGSYIESVRFIDLWEKKYLANFRTVMWIDTAVGAAKLAMYPIREVVFAPSGAYGGAMCEGWTSRHTRWFSIEDRLAWGDHASRIARRHPAILSAMQIQSPLSADIDPLTGALSWRADDCGSIVVNRSGRLLCLSASDAQRYQFSIGVAKSLPEVMHLLGVERYVPAGEEVAAFLQRAAQQAHHEFDRFNVAMAHAQGRAAEFVRVGHRARAGEIISSIRHFALARRLYDDNPYIREMYDYDEFFKTLWDQLVTAVYSWFEKRS